jgi:hypothetical protein
MKFFVAAWLALLTALGVFVFPGRTYLLSDTQIYLPLFQHLQDPRLFQTELIREGAHLAYTIYDEVTLGLQRWTGLDFECCLLAQQLFFRWMGLWGMYALGRSLGFSPGGSVLGSAVVWLGAFIHGPAVITTEFEPVPRGFAVPLAAAALGAIAQGRQGWAGAFLGVGLLYHFPAVWPMLAIAVLTRQWRVLSGPVAAAALLAVSAKLQPGGIEAQPFFSLIDPEHRVILQTRAAYNWITLWQGRYIWHFLLSGGLALAAYWRLRWRLRSEVRRYFVGVTLLALAMMPVSYALLEGLGWALFPQLQPMRALLYCHLFCQMLGVLAAGEELREGRWRRAGLWLLTPLTLALRGDIFQMGSGAWGKQLVLVALLALTVWVAARVKRQELAFALSLVLAPLFGEVLNARAYTPLETPALRELARWAEKNTGVGAVYFFPDLGRRLEPGIFRARARRTVYVCWKQGGQVNYFPRYATEWWSRWNALLAPGHPPLDYEDLRRRGITHLVFTKEKPAEDLPEVYAGEGYRVYELSSQASTSARVGAED